MTPKHPENQRTLSGWRELIARQRTTGMRVATLVQAVEAHMSPTSYYDNIGGRCAALLKRCGGDPLLAMDCLFEAMGSKDRRGDPALYAMGIIRRMRNETARVGDGGGGESATAIDLLEWAKVSA